MPIPGEWFLSFDWGCDGAYGYTTMTINADGTWTNGEGYTGQWVAVAGQLMFEFDNSRTTYAGNLAGTSATGIQTTFGGLDGCFLLVQEGPTAAFSESRRAEGKADSAGSM
jgi:hypothetical protein